MRTIIALGAGLFIGCAASGLMAATAEPVSLAAVKAEVASLKKLVETNKAETSARVAGLQSRVEDLGQRLKSIESGEAKQLSLGEPLLKH